MSGTPDEQLLVRYVLGELPEEECIEIEKLCLERDDLFEQLEAVEAELTDDYVRGVLVERRRKEFERRFLTASGGSEAIQFARLVAKSAHPEPGLLESVKAWFHHIGLQTRMAQASIAAILVLIVAIGWLSLRNRTSRSEPFQAARRESPMRGAPAPFIATFTLAAGSVRGNDENNEITIPREAKRVRFRIGLPSNDRKTYSVSLNRVEGERLFSQNGVKSTHSNAGETLSVEISANALPPGTSVLSVSSIGANGASEDIAKYVIRIHRQ